MARFESVPPRTFMGLPGLLFFYRERLREQRVEELFAGLGIAVAVALLFAVTVASQSIASSAEEVNRTLVGPATLQLRARGPEGLAEHMLGRVEDLKGVRHAAPLLEEDATIVAHGGASVPVTLAGTDVSLAVLDGLVHTLPISTLSSEGIGLSKASAEALRLPRAQAQSPEPAVRLELRGHAIRLPVNTVLGAETFGALSQARVAIMPLERLQALAGLPHRLTRILVQSAPGEQARVRSELTALAAGRLTVAPANQDVRLLHVALRPSEQASLFFAAISALLGFLLTFNAFLLTVPERRRAIADLRLRGVSSSAIAQMVLFQALCLGVIATAVGLLVGYGLSVDVFAQTPSYLAKGFTLGSSTVVGVAPLLVAGIGGVLATCLASIVPLLDLRRSRAANAVYLEDGEPGNALGSRAALGLALIAVALVIVRMGANSLWPSLALAWTAMLALAAVLCVPILFRSALWVGDAIARRFQAHLKLLPLALESLRETTLRSLALVATGAAALFGAVALGGARDDLVRGIGGFAAHYSRGAGIWVVTPGDNQSVIAFSSNDREQRVAGLPGVGSVDALSGSMLDVGNRRIWVLAWPSNSRLALLDGQIIKGNLATAVARLRAGGWATVSQQLAAEHDAGVGGALALPTPTGELRVRIAALTTNFGWTPGAVLLNTTDYAHAWDTTQKTALAVQIRQGVNPSVVQGAIEHALGPGNGLEVLTAHDREAKINGSAREGLSQLATISTLLVLASILAMAAALASAIWQRRSTLASLKLSGVRSSRLRRLLLLESAVMLGVGAVTGAAWGIYGQVALDGYLTASTGFPVMRLEASWRPFEVLVVVFIASLAVSAIPAWFTARVSARVALQE
ncbi:MAG TPA: FtsX-like permease family protein [Solirubrobacteraceae bacterium]|jgi:putative ABC transport system permease protein|nr:FtsX-like permease family protein [Solirubrobacteraceae bacterium]